MDQRGGARSRAKGGLVVLVMLLIIGATARGIWQQVDRLRQIRAIQAELQAQIQYEKERKQSLEAELRRLSSSGYAEEWARVYGGMVRPGEIRLVVPEGER